MSDNHSTYQLSEVSTAAKRIQKQLITHGKKDSRQGQACRSAEQIKTLFLKLLKIDWPKQPRTCRNDLAVQRGFLKILRQRKFTSVWQDLAQFLGPGRCNHWVSLDVPWFFYWSPWFKTHRCSHHPFGCTVARGGPQLEPLKPRVSKRVGNVTQAQQQHGDMQHGVWMGDMQLSMSPHEQLVDRGLGTRNTRTRNTYEELRSCQCQVCCVGFQGSA